MAKQTIAELESILDKAAGSLPKVSSKKMFGCYALWAGDNVFALVWKHGRIGFKLPDETSYETLLSISGAEPWKAGPMKMAHWVLVPEGYHSKIPELQSWAKKSHAQCEKLEKKPKNSTKTKLASKIVKKRKAT